MTTTNTDRFVSALRRKFSSPRAVLARLGLDAKLLSDAEVLEESSDPDRHFTGRYVRFEDQPPEVRGRVADDEEDEPRAKSWSVDELKREHLRDLGFSEDQIDRLHCHLLGERDAVPRDAMHEHPHKGAAAGIDRNPFSDMREWRTGSDVTGEVALDEAKRSARRLDGHDRNALLSFPNGPRGRGPTIAGDKDYAAEFYQRFPDARRLSSF